MVNEAVVCRAAGPHTEPVYYTLPAEDMTQGMSTDDGERILDVHADGGLVLYDVYSPAENDDEDHDRRCAPERRIRPVGTRVKLGVFFNTRVDGTTHEHAVVLPADPADRGH